MSHFKIKRRSIVNLATMASVLWCLAGSVNAQSKQVEVTHGPTTVRSGSEAVVIRRGDVYEVVKDLGQFYLATVRGKEFPIPKHYTRTVTAPAQGEYFRDSLLGLDLDFISNEATDWEFVAKIHQVSTDSLAEQLDMRAGEWIVEVNGRTVRNIDRYRQAVRRGFGDLELVVVNPQSQQKRVVDATREILLGDAARTITWGKPPRLDIRFRPTTRGLRITEVFQGGLGDQLQLQPGDLIYSANDIRVRTTKQYRIAASSQNGQLKLVVANPLGTKRVVHATPQPVPPSQLGVFGTSNPALGGFRVTFVRPNSIASQLNLVAGDTIMTVNGTPISDAQDLQLAEAAAAGQFQIEVIDANNAYTLRSTN